MSAAARIAQLEAAIRAALRNPALPAHVADKLRAAMEDAA